MPAGWDGRIYRRKDNGDGGSTLPVFHASTYSLRSESGGEGGDFGSTVVPMLGPSDVFVSIVEYGAPATARIFSERTGIPGPLQPPDFHPSVMQRLVPGMAGTQLFFNASDRAFCLYAVIGSFADAGTLCGKVNELLASVEISSLVHERGGSVP